jgi:hypothetical protein
MNDVTSWKVLCPVEGRNNKTRWIWIGRAYRNRDGSTNVYLDALPSNSRLQLREWEEDEARPSNGSNGSNNRPHTQMALDAPSDIPF